MLIILGLLSLAILMVPTRVYLAVFPLSRLPQIEAPMAFAIVIAIAVAQSIAALLFYSAARQAKERPFPNIMPSARHKGLRRTIITVILAMALLAKSFHTLYWLIVWDSTYDPFSILWISLILFLVIMVCAILAVVSPAQMRPTAWLLVLVIPLLILAFAAFAQRVDFRQLTTARADRVDQAIESFHDREGRYPETLRQLIPRDLLFLGEPVILFGQTWCYHGGADAYRLGYVDRLHWSDPNLFGHLHSGQGDMVDEPVLCAPEIAGLQSRNPDFFQSLD